MAFGTNEVRGLLHTMLMTYRFEVPTNYEIEWDLTSMPVLTDEFPVTLRRLGRTGSGRAASGETGVLVGVELAAPYRTGLQSKYAASAAPPA